MIFSTANIDMSNYTPDQIAYAEQLVAKDNAMFAELDKGKTVKLKIGGHVVKVTNNKNIYKYSVRLK